MNSGAECSTSRNPLAQFTKHTSEDRSLQHERFGPSAPQHAGMRSTPQQMSSQDAQLMQNFMGPAEAQQQNNAFRFDQVNRELNNIQRMGGAGGSAGSAWVSDFAAQGSAPAATAGPISASHTPVSVEGVRWTSEFNPNQTFSNGGSPAPLMMNSMMNRPSMIGGGFQGLGARPMMQTPVAKSDTSGGRVVELDSKHWEDQFKKFEEQALNEKGKTATQESEQQQQANGQTNEDLLPKEASQEELDAFENVWENIRSQVMEGIDDWVPGPHDYETDMGNAWDRDFNQFTRNRPEYGEYQFESRNKYLEHPDPFQIGVQLMESGGNLSEAALAFEAAVQKNPDHAEAWGRLGSCQAQNEKEDPAIRALERCIMIDPGNLTALMNLAVSYINENYENAAYSTLEKWIATKYPEIVNQARGQEPKLGNEDRYQLHSRVTELFIRAAQLSPDGANMDADVQDGLGVLFYGNEEFDKAIDCFNAAIAARPNDPLLWNRLGATLANSSRSEEAIEAYSRALQLRPSFARARYNVGVSCINIGCYHEAAQHLLTALSMDHTPEEEALANQSTNLYSTLKRVFAAMNRKDLEAKVGVGMNLDEFRKEFDF